MNGGRIKIHICLSAKKSQYYGKNRKCDGQNSLYSIELYILPPPKNCPSPFGHEITTSLHGFESRAPANYDVIRHLVTDR